MVLKNSRKLAGLSFEDIAAAVDEDGDFRAAIIRHLAKNHSDDYLTHVNVSASLLRNLSARAVVSAKEWQE